jgi:hypothetical protein
MELDKQLNKIEENIEIPDNVVNEEAYKDYLRQREFIYNHKDRFYTTSIGIKQDMFATCYVIQKKFKKDLPEEEIEKMMEINKWIRSELGKVTTFKRKAFGYSADCAENSIKIGSRKAEVIEMFGKFFSAKEVHKVLVEDFGIECEVSSVELFRRKYWPVIEEKQKEYKKGYEGIRLGYKRSRLEEYSLAVINLNQRLEHNWNREDYKVWLQTLEAIRKEVEGDRLTIDGELNIKIEETLNYHIYQETLQQLNINQLIVSKIANRLNKSPLNLMFKLEHSCYSKLNGFGKRDVGSEIEYPSHIIYNFDDIKQKHEQLHQKEIEEAKIVNEDLKSDGIINDKKQALLDIIRRKSFDINHTVTKINSFDKKRGLKARQDEEDYLTKDRTGQKIGKNYKTEKLEDFKPIGDQKKRFIEKQNRLAVKKKCKKRK